MDGLTKKMAAVSIAMALSTPALAHESEHYRLHDIESLMSAAKNMEADGATRRCANLKHPLSDEFVTSVKQGFEEKNKGYAFSYEVLEGVAYFCLTKNKNV